MEDEDVGTGGPSAMGTNDSNIVMEDILEMLKLLDYENKFCKNKGFKPLSKVYFSQPAANPSE
jgi:hypothetical protein